MSESSVPFRHPWPERIFGEVGSITVGGTPSTSVPEYWGGDIPWMASGDVHSRVIDDVPTRISELGLRHSSAKMVDPPSVAVALAGQGRTRGTAAYVRRALCTNQSVALLKGNPGELDTEYLLHNLSFRYSELRSRSAGGGRAGLTKTILEQLPIPLPAAVPEQSKIAEVLSTIDRVIEQTEVVVAKQHRVKTGLMQDLLTRGIDEHGNLRSEQTHEFKDSPLGRIPVEWDIASVGSVAESVTSGSRGWAKYYREEGALFIRIGNLTREHINLRLDDLVFVQPPKSAEGLRTAVQEGDLLISVTADLGIIGVIPKGFVEGYVNQHIALARLLPADVSARFVGWFLASREGRAQFDRLNESGAKAGLNLPTVRSLLFPRPDDIDEQYRIAFAIDACVKPLTSMVVVCRSCGRSSAASCRTCSQATAA